MLYLVAFLFLVGGTRRSILYLGMFLVVLLLWGYQLNVARQVAVDPEPPAPPLDRMGHYVRDGLRGSVVAATLVTPGVVLIAVGSMLHWSFPTLSAVAFASGVVLLLTASYVIPASLTVLATTDRIQTALQPSEILDIVDTEDYAVAWFVGTGMRLGGLLLFLMIVGVLLWFYVEMASTYVYAVGVSQLDSIDSDME